MKHPLSLHILYHSRNLEGQKLYSDLYKLLCRDYNGKSPLARMAVPI